MDMATFVTVIWVLLLIVVVPTVMPVPEKLTVLLATKLVPVSTSVGIVVAKSPEVTDRFVRFGAVAAVA